MLLLEIVDDGKNGRLIEYASSPLPELFIMIPILYNEKGKILVLLQWIVLEVVIILEKDESKWLTNKVDWQI